MVSVQEQEHGSVLDIQNVSHEYRQSEGDQPLTALRDVSLQLEAGTVYGLVGVNGAGKTTLLEIAAGALEPTEGNVLVDGRRAGSPRRHPRLLAAVGYCPDTPVFPTRLRVREIFREFGVFRGLVPRQVDQHVGLVDQYLGVEELLDHEVDELSHGNRVRVGVAVATLGRPPVILLDESFGPLDPLVRRKLRGFINELSEQGSAVLVSSHELEQLERVVDQIHVLHDGIRVGPYGPEQFRSQKFLRIRIDGLDRRKRDDLQSLFPESTVAQDTVLVPWSGSQQEKSRIARQLADSGFTDAEVIDSVERSLESVLVDVVENADTTMRVE